MAPSKMKAAVLVDHGVQNVQVKDVDTPRPGLGEILVKVAVGGQNPAEWKIAETKGFGVPGAILGNDYSGIVEELGESAENHGFKKGDRVGGVIFGGIKEGVGSWAEYAVADHDKTYKLPQSISFEDGASISICAATAFQMMWQSLNLYYTPDSPSPSNDLVLVWGASSGVGWFATQFAKLCGFRVVATASPKHHGAIKGLGAEAVFDYKDAGVAKKIKDYSNGQIKYAWDSISEHGSTELVANALSDEGGKIATVLPWPFKGIVKPEVTVLSVNGYSFYTDDSNIKLSGKEFIRVITKLLAENKLKFLPANTTFGPGLNGVQKGLEYHKAGKVSGEKIAYIIADTPK